MDEIDELHIHENAFKGMRNLLFLNIYTKKYDLEKEVRWHLPEGFNYLPHKLRFLRLDGYPMRYMPSSFRPENLVKLQMSGSKLERLWEGVHKLRGLKEIDLQRSRSLKEIPDLSMATNLKRLDLCHCSSLVELPSSIHCLNKLKRLVMTGCKNLETLPTGINLPSLYWFDLEGCSKLKSFPGISTNISYLSLSETRIDEFPSKLRLQNLVNLKMCRMKSEALWDIVQPLTPLMTMLSHSLTRLFLSDIPSLVELPSSIQNFSKLEYFWITECINLETLPTGINLKYLRDLYLTGCSRLKTFPDISTNISSLYLTRTGIEEVPWWIQKFSMLKYLNMNGCNRLQCVSLHISKLKDLHMVDFSNCGALTEASWSDSSISVMAMETGKKLPVLDEASSSFPGNFIDCFNFDQECLLQRQTIYSKFMRLSGDEVPSYFTHRTTGTSLTNISLLHTSPSQVPFVKFKACAVVDSESSLYENFRFDIYVSCRFKGRLGKHFESPDRRSSFGKDEKGIHILVFECSFPLNEDSASQAELNYDHVDIQFRLSNRNGSTSKLKGCGIRLFKDRPLICESDEENMVNETEHSEESGDSNVETERSRKRMRIT